MPSPFDLDAAAGTITAEAAELRQAILGWFRNRGEDLGTFAAAHQHPDFELALAGVTSGAEPEGPVPETDPVNAEAAAQQVASEPEAQIDPVEAAMSEQH